MAQADPASITRRVYPTQRFNCGVSRRRLSDPRPSLADDCMLQRPDPAGFDDPDYELFSWPETMDQRWIGMPDRGRLAFEDAEMDDGV